MSLPPFVCECGERYNYLGAVDRCRETHYPPEDEPEEVEDDEEKPK